VHVSWYDASHRDGLVALVRSVAAVGGAVGWLQVPEPEEVLEWVDGLPAAGVRLAIASDQGEVLGCGGLRRLRPVVVRGMAEITKVMTSPEAARTGVGQLVMDLLITTAQQDAVELLTLKCRGNNHGALRLYARCGFQVTGRRPDAIAVGNERFDQVLMHRDLRSEPDGLLRHGSRREGPGAS
jgi:ribosomal protein S18 acetylase RimI-like enzyme